MGKDISYSILRQKWRDMKKRCYNPKSNNYKYYGGRGIKVCDDWKNNFNNFYKWALENGFDYKKNRKEQSLDRIDNNKNYEPNNCRFTNMNIQNINMRHKPNKTGYIGIYLHTSKTNFYGALKINGKRIYTGKSKSKNHCAKLRNDYIIKHNLNNKLNEIKDELEAIII